MLPYKEFDIFICGEKREGITEVKIPLNKNQHSVTDIPNIINRDGRNMERFAWKARVLPGKLEEYVRRHDEIWPEMTEVLNEAGIRNYTIWNVGDELFGFYECDSVEHASRVQAKSAVVDRWNKYMKEVMEMEIDPETGTSVLLRQVFLHGGADR